MKVVGYVFIAGCVGLDPVDTDPVPANEACHTDVEDWPSAATTIEDEMLEAVNLARAVGGNCGDAGSFAPSEPVSSSDELQCAARFHAAYMAETGVLSHDSEGGALGDDVQERLARAGYGASAFGEVVAAGYLDAEEVVAGWLGSDEHCSILLGSEWLDVGFGYVNAPDSEFGTWWVGDFARP